METGLPDSSSEAAEEGTAAHELAALCLTLGDDTAGYEGRIMSNGVAVDGEMVELVQGYLHHVRALVASTGGVLRVEQALPIGHITREADAVGTGDVVILAGEEIICIDLKYGRKKVRIENNPQLALYGLGALRAFELFGNFTAVLMMIYQPRLAHYPEQVRTVEELIAHGEEIALAAAKVWDNIERARIEGTATLDLSPGEEQCRYCKAAGSCPAQDRFIEELLCAPLEEIAASPLAVQSPEDDAEGNALGHRLDAVDAVESWCEAVRKVARAELADGRPVIGAAGAYKLVAGRKGNRQWKDEAEAIKVMKRVKLKKGEMYNEKLISPADAEKLHKAKTLSDFNWAKLQHQITQSEGKPAMAPGDDPRPAIAKQVEEEFTDLTIDAAGN